MTLAMPQSGIYAITPSDLRDESQLLRQTELALENGIALLQYRDKQASQPRRKRLAAELLKLCHRYNVPLIINDDIQLAAECNADGVHLGQQDGSLKSARQQLGSTAIIGSTCHGQSELAKAAVAASANYVAFGRFFASNTKASAQPADSHVLRGDYCVPVVAIGGVIAANGSELLQAGADLLAVCEAIYGAEDIATATRELSQLF